MFARSDANEGIRFPLMANGRQRSVSWMHDGVPVQGPEVGVDRSGQQLEVAAGVGQIRATDRARKQRIAHEEVVGGALNPKQEANATEGVAWRVQDFEGKATDVDRFTVRKVMIGQGRFR